MRKIILAAALLSSPAIAAPPIVSGGADFAARVAADPAKYQFGARGDGVTDDYGALQAQQNACLASQGSGNLTLPRVPQVVLRPSALPYMVSAPLIIYCPTNFNGALLKASAAMESVIQIGSATYQAHGFVIDNVNVDAARLANTGVWFNRWSNVRLDHPNVHNAALTGIRIGDGSTGTVGYEAYVTNFLIDWTAAPSSSTYPTGSAALMVDTDATDYRIVHGLAMDAETAVVVKSSGSTSTLIEDVHAWNHWQATAPLVTCFDDYVGGVKYISDVADGCGTYGFRARSTGFLGYFNTALLANNTDNTTIAFHFDIAGPAATLIGNKIVGADSTHRFAKDFDYTSPTGTIREASSATNTVTQLALGTWSSCNGSLACISYNNGNQLSFNNPGTNYISSSGPLVLGPTGALTVSGAGGAVGITGEIAQAKTTASGTAPGAGFCKIAWVAGTTGGTGKIIAYCGTSTTPVTIVDNVGAGF